MTRLLCLLCLALLTTSAPAQRSPTPAAASPVVSVSCCGGQSVGTAVIVHVLETLPGDQGQRAIALTACHVVDVFADATVDGYTGPPVDSFELHFTDGREAKGCTVLLRDPDSDLATLLVWTPPGVQPLKIAAEATAGERVTIDTRRDRHRDHGLATVKATTCLGAELVIDAKGRAGNSGGAVLNEAGELAGVVFEVGDWTDEAPWGWPVKAVGPFHCQQLLSSSILAVVDAGR